jgi:hypothetical protein
MKKEIESLQVALEEEQNQHETQEHEAATLQETSSQIRIELEKSLETLKVF